MEQNNGNKVSYLKFFAMIGTSMIILGMYKNRKANIAIFIGAAVLLFLSVWLVRSQVTVSSVDYMEGMIPHHSIAILTNERAGIEDPRVRELADEIIEAQQRDKRDGMVDRGYQNQWRG